MFAKFLCLLFFLVSNLLVFAHAENNPEEREPFADFCKNHNNKYAIKNFLTEYESAITEDEVNSLFSEDISFLNSWQIALTSDALSDHLKNFIKENTLNKLLRTISIAWFYDKEKYHNDAKKIINFVFTDKVLKSKLNTLGVSQVFFIVHYHDLNDEIMLILDDEELKENIDKETMVKVVLHANTKGNCYLLDLIRNDEMLISLVEEEALSEKEPSREAQLAFKILENKSWWCAFPSYVLGLFWANE